MCTTFFRFCFAVAIVILSSFIRAEAHLQPVHQYLVREGYTLLKTTVGAEIPYMMNHVGTTEIGNNPWRTGMMVTGAWREDEEDPVYLYGDPIPGKSGSHFWVADQGDESEVTLRWLSSGVPSQATAASAYKKIRRYAYPGVYGAWTVKITFEQFMENHFGCGPPLIAGVGIQYDDLVDLYKTGNAYTVGYFFENYVSCPERIPITLPQFYRDLIVWEVLGRMAHLLGDMSVPAHAHGDVHGICDSWPIGGTGHDTYENWVGADEIAYGSPYLAWNATNAGPMLNPYLATDPLHYIMYVTNQVADHFGSNGIYDGEGNNYTTYTSGAYGFLQPYLQTLGNPILHNEFSCCSDYYAICLNRDGTSIENRERIRDATFPLAIRATAGLFYWFATETDLISKIVVKNDFNGGEVKVNDFEYPSGTPHGLLFGSTISSLRSFTQFYDNYWRVPKTWQKIRNGAIEVVRYDSVWTNISVDGSATYSATFSRVFDVTIREAINIEGGGSGTYKVNGGSEVPTWGGGFEEGSLTPIHIDAVPPSSAFSFSHWSDSDEDKFNNPRDLLPIDHTLNLHAFFKARLGSSLPSATAPNNQRKLVYFGGKHHMVYSSGGEIWYCNSTNNGTTWSNESLVSDGSGLNMSPSIAATLWLDNGWQTIVGIAWEKRDNGSEYSSEVLFRLFNLTNGTWTSTQLIFGSPGDSPSFSGATPALTVTSNFWTIAFAVPVHSSFNPNGGIFVWAFDAFAGVDKGIQYVPSTGPTSRYPSAAEYTNQLSGSNNVGLAWAQGETILYSFITKNAVGVPIGFSSVENVSLGSGYILHTSPSLQFETGSPYRPVVAWQAFDVDFTLTTRILQRRKESGGWGVFADYPGGAYANRFIEAMPSITRRGAGSNLALTYHVGSTTYIAQYDISWGPRTALSGTKVHPNLAFDNSSPYDKIRILCADNSTTPVTIRTDWPNEKGVEETWKVTTSSSESAFRKVTMTTDGMSYSAIMRFIAPLDGPVGTLPEILDSLVVSSTEDAENFVQVSPMTIPPDGMLTGEFSLASIRRDSSLTGDARVIIKMRVFDSGRGTLLATVPLDTLTRNRIGVRNKSFNLNLLALRGRSVRFKIRPEVYGATNATWSASVVFEDSLESVRAQKPSVQGIEVGIPMLHTLYPNHPNPFNPSTQFRFELPEPSNVTLVIYDILGRQVAELLKGEFEAGYHSITWNASSFASGIYLARFTAIDASGAVKLSTTQKLLLTK